MADGTMAASKGMVAAWYLGPPLLAAAALWAIAPAPAERALLIGLAVVAGAAAAAILWQPAWGALALIAFVYSNLPGVITQQGGGTWELTALLIWTAAAWLAHQGMRRDSPPLRWPLWLPLLIWGVLMVIAGWRGVNHPDSIVAVEGYGKSVLILYLIVNLLRTPRRLHAAIQALLAVVVLMAAPVIYQGVTGSNYDFGGFATRTFEETSPGVMGWRLGGSMGDPNFLALMLVATLPLAGMEMLEPQARTARALGGLAIAMTLMAAVFTYSRGALLGIVFAAAALAWHQRRRTLWLALSAALGVVVVAALPQAYRARLLSLRELSLTAPQQSIPDASFRGRRSELLAGVLMWRTHPWLGVGTGAYADAYERYSGWLGLDPRGEMRDPHNLYVERASETGTLGLLAFLGLIAAALIELRRTRHLFARRGAATWAHAARGVELSIETYLLMSLFLHGAYFRNFYLLLALAAGYIAFGRVWRRAAAAAPAPPLAAASGA